MSTTTIRLSPELKVKLASAARALGTTPHNFILEAIAEKAEQEERRQDFIDEAQQRYAKILATGKTVPWSEMKVFLQKRASGASARKPSAKKMVR
jgi:predicted transcriptional regulator